MSDHVTTPTGLDMDEDMSRRGFIRIATYGVSLAYLGAMGYPIYRYLNAPVETATAAAAVTNVTLDKADALAKGSALIFRFGVRPAMLIHHTDDTWAALDAVCTHMGCTVNFDAAQNKIVCGCHGGEFDPKTGDNIGGPPPRPLGTFKVEVRPGSVLVSRA